MIRGAFESAGERTATELRDAYVERLREVISAVGVETVVDRSGVDRETVEAVADGEDPELTLETATAVLAADDERPDAETVAMEARDILLMGMTTAVVDVEAVSAGLGGSMDPKEIQQKVEGRQPMTLTEYAQIHQFVAARS